MNLIAYIRGLFAKPVAPAAPVEEPKFKHEGFVYTYKRWRNYQLPYKHGRLMRESMSPELLEEYDNRHLTKVQLEHKKMLDRATTFTEQS